MASRGNVETTMLRENIEGQLKRLLTQLQDIEGMKEEFDDDDEYFCTRQETIEQLKEFEISLHKMVAGNISLVDHIGSVQLAIQSAIRTSTSPEVLNMFLKKENGALRSRLSSLESDFRLGRISIDAYNSQALEIIKMLDKLKEPLSPNEQEMLRKGIKSLEGYENATIDIDSKVIHTATRELGNV